MANQDLESPLANTLRKKPASSVAKAVASALKFYYTTNANTMGTYFSYVCGCAFDGTGLVGFLPNPQWSSGGCLAAGTSLFGGSGRPYLLSGSPKEVKKENGALIAICLGNSGSYTGGSFVEDATLRRGLKRDSSYSDNNTVVAYHNGVAYVADSYSSYTIDAYELPAAGGNGPLLKWTRSYSAPSQIYKATCSPAGRLYTVHGSVVAEISTVDGSVIKTVAIPYPMGTSAKAVATSDSLVVAFNDGSSTIYVMAFDLDLTQYIPFTISASPSNNTMHLCSDGKDAWMSYAYGSSNAPSAGYGGIYRINKDGYEVVYNKSFSNGGYAYSTGIDYDPTTGMIHVMDYSISYGFLASTQWQAVRLWALTAQLPTLAQKQPPQKQTCLTTAHLRLQPYLKKRHSRTCFRA